MRALGFLLGLLTVSGMFAMAIHRQEVVLVPAVDPWRSTIESGFAPEPDPGAAGSPAMEQAASTGDVQVPREPPVAATGGTATGPDEMTEPSGSIVADGEAGAVVDRATDSAAPAEGTGVTEEDPGFDEPSLPDPAQTRARLEPRSQSAAAEPAGAETQPNRPLETLALPGNRASTAISPEPSVEPGTVEHGTGTESGLPELPLGEQPGWQPFWRPFNTRASAQGFAETVAAQTDLDVRAVPDGPGTYRVAYAYHSEEERRQRHQRIEDALGVRIDTP